MKSFRARIKLDQRGVALFIVLASMATLAIFVGEITYTAQINQKLAYDQLDQVKAQALAKSGLRMALLRIRAYSELKKTVSKIADSAGASKSTVAAMVPASVVEKIWAEPITIPFSGDISSLPGSVKDALLKFRKDSGLEGKLYISIQAQSTKFNLNSVLPHFAATASPTPTPKPGGGAAATPTPSADGANPSPTPITYSAESARLGLTQHLKEIFARKSESDERFRDEFRNYRIEDLSEDILGWSDLSYESPREQLTKIPFKKAPFYHLSELHYLESMEDQLYELLSNEFSAGVNSEINVNRIKEPVLTALVPQMTPEERKAFFEFRDSTTADNIFKSSDDFYKYLKESVQYYKGSDSRTEDLKNSLIQRGIVLTVDELNFFVRIEATVQQTKKTLEAMVSLIEEKPQARPTAPPGSAPPTSPQPPNPNGVQNQSNLKITQLRFL